MNTLSHMNWYLKPLTVTFLVSKGELDHYYDFCLNSQDSAGKKMLSHVNPAILKAQPKSSPRVSPPTTTTDTELSTSQESVDRIQVTCELKWEKTTTKT